MITNRNMFSGIGNILIDIINSRHTDSNRVVRRHAILRKEWDDHQIQKEWTGEMRMKARSYEWYTSKEAVCGCK